MRNIFIGTSGYSYQHWKNTFYPPRLSSQKWLEFYSRYFNVVELNVTFYRLPPKKTFESWYKRTPRGFRFVLKGSRFITHIKRMAGCQDALKIFFDNASALREKLLCVLWQFPPSLSLEQERLKKFIIFLKKNTSCLQALEFRNESWFNDDTYKLLKKHKVSLCIADSPNFPSYELITAHFLYLRFHGGKILYGSEYSEKELLNWARKAKRWLKEINLLMAFFNNDAQGFAVKNALRFDKLLKHSGANDGI